MNQSIPDKNINKSVNGYILNANFSQANVDLIATLQDELRVHFADILWFTPLEALHITLLDWIAPLVEYDEPKDRLFSRVYSLYDMTFSSILEPIKPISVQFDSLIVTPSALIICGHDSGEFQAIRNSFTGTIELPPDTTQPPKIIHSTVARFKKPWTNRSRGIPRYC